MRSWQAALPVLTASATSRLAGPTPFAGAGCKAVINNRVPEYVDTVDHLGLRLQGE